MSIERGHELKRVFQVIIYSLLLSFFFSACTKKLDPEQEAAKERDEIIKEAPINLEYKINPPADGLSQKLKMFSGHWVGKWNDVIPSQLVVTDIDKEHVTFIYSWGSAPQREIEAGSLKKTVELKSDDKIEFKQNELLTTFVINTILNKVIGAQIDGDEVHNIVMEKVK